MRVDFCLGIIPRDLPIDVGLLFIDDVSRFVLFLAMALVDIPRADLDTFFHIPFGPHLVKCLYYVSVFRFHIIRSTFFQASSRSTSSLG
jgi:hypothetical protein